MITTVKLVRHPAPHMDLFLCVVSYSLCKFQVYNTGLLTVVTLLYIRSLKFIPTFLKFVPFNQHFPISITLSALGSHGSVLCF